MFSTLIGLLPPVSHGGTREEATRLTAIMKCPVALHPRFFAGDMSCGNDDGRGQAECQHESPYLIPIIDGGNYRGMSADQFASASCSIHFQPRRHPDPVDCKSDWEVLGNFCTSIGCEHGKPARCNLTVWSVTPSFPYVKKSETPHHLRPIPDNPPLPPPQKHTYTHTLTIHPPKTQPWHSYLRHSLNKGFASSCMIDAKFTT